MSEDREIAKIKENILRISAQVRIINMNQADVAKKASREAIKSAFNEIETLIIPTTKSLGQRTELYLHESRTKLANLLSEYQFLRSKLEDRIKFLDSQGDSIPSPLEQGEMGEGLCESGGVCSVAVERTQEEDIAVLESQTHEIISAMRDLNETTTMINRELKSQQNYIIAVDETTGSSIQTMKSGNEQLDKAKDYQPKCRI